MAFKNVLHSISAWHIPNYVDSL